MASKRYECVVALVPTKQGMSPRTSQAQFSEGMTNVAGHYRSPQVTTRSLHHVTTGSLRLQKSYSALAEVHSQLSAQTVCRSRRRPCAQMRAMPNPKPLRLIEALL